MLRNGSRLYRNNRNSRETRRNRKRQVFMRTRVDQNEILIRGETITAEEFKFAGEAYIQVKLNTKLHEIIVP
jgi:hypothetical protein